MPLLNRFLSSTGVRTIAVLLLPYLIFKGWMYVAAPSRIDPAVAAQAAEGGRIAVEVVLPFAPERFHVLKIQEHARIRRVNGNTVQVRSIDRAGIEALARSYYWIEQIRPEQQPS